MCFGRHELFGDGDCFVLFACFAEIGAGWLLLFREFWSRGCVLLVSGVVMAEVYFSCFPL